MAVKLNNGSYAFAKRLVEQGHVALDDRGDWSEHQPSAAAQNRFIEEHGIDAYARWHLAIDNERREGTKARYKFPYGDFEDVHRCAVLAAESRAGQRKYTDVELAAAHLHGMMESLRASR
ncbi:MAG: hypothetical protein QOE86_1614 [Solirubrobacteraceae bacterium]|jgi:hypothetical protein|nr:hypothetical protein [Solirubrobacteraceae bacterium]